MNMPCLTTTRSYLKRGNCMNQLIRLLKEAIKVKNELIAEYEKTIDLQNQIIAGLNNSVDLLKEIVETKDRTIAELWKGVRDGEADEV